MTAMELTPPPAIEHGQPLTPRHLQYYEAELGKIDAVRALTLPRALQALADLDALEAAIWPVLARHGVTTRAQLQWEAFRG